jgi:NAD(P)-dependent dehydrogenase (short-subunit alcohol dehydrogenase family)
MSAGAFAGQAAIVTGGASGIGLAVAKRLAGAGAGVAVVDLSEERVEQAVASLDGAAEHLAIALDVRDPEAMDRMREDVMAKWGRIDILVTSAGILRGVPGRLQTLSETAVEAWDRVIDTNLTGVFLANRAVLPVMFRQKRGNVVNLSSTSGRHGQAYDSAYCASKFGVVGLSECLAEEARPHGVRVQVVLPEMVDTPMLEQNGPMPRPAQLLSADRVADLILHLLRLPEDTTLLSPVLGSFRAGRAASGTKRG